MTFNSREVFTIEPRWPALPRASFEYDLRELRLGFGTRRFGQTAEHVVHGWELQLALDTEAEIVACDAFFTALKGRLTGFWLPTPIRALRITAGVGTTQFDIEDQQLTDRWQDTPQQFLWFTRSGDTPQPAQITAVADNGNGTERVTLTGALTTAVDQTWDCYRLIYVRLAGDEETWEAVSENIEHRTIRVVELPLEYTAVETGQQPVYLYHFWADYGGTLVHWRFTSFQSNITSNAQVFTAQAITHGALRKSLRGQTEEVELRATYESGQPLAEFFPVVLARPLWLEILEAPYATPNSTTVLFTGRVGAPRKKGMEITAKVRSILDALLRPLPGMIIGSRCNYSLYETNTCKVSKATHANTCTFASISANQIVLNGTFLSADDDYFALGWLQTGTGDELEVVDILQSSYDGGTVQHTLWLARPLRFAAVSDAAVCYPGCAKTPTVCEEKFSNYVNYGGHPIVPVTSLSVRAMPQDVANGNVK